MPETMPMLLFPPLFKKQPATDTTAPSGDLVSLMTATDSETLTAVVAIEFEARAETKEKLVSILEDSFRAGSPREMEEEEERALALADGDVTLFADLAYDEEIRIDVRGLAARMFVSQIGGIQIHVTRGILKWRPHYETYKTFKTHESPLIRLGVVLGLEKLGETDELADFYEDPDLEVRETATEAISEAEG